MPDPASMPTVHRSTLGFVFAMGCVHRALPLAPVAPPAAPPPVARVVDAVVDPACEDVALPAINAVIRLPATYVGRALRPVIHAVCACTRAGVTVRVRSRIEPEAGLVGAHVEGDDAVDGCVQRTLVGAFEPFVVGSDAIARETYRPTPRRRSASVEATTTTRITYPFVLVHR